MCKNQRKRGQPVQMRENQKEKRKCNNKIKKGKKNTKIEAQKSKTREVKGNTTQCLFYNLVISDFVCKL